MSLSQLLLNEELSDGLTSKRQQELGKTKPNLKKVVLVQYILVKNPDNLIQNPTKYLVSFQFKVLSEHPIAFYTHTQKVIQNISLKLQCWEVSLRYHAVF